jgi:2-keto-4-pentenoate hydratase/2-oxohepta-3-ene-1,7-dioic acid hydratase in catechol pathway
MRLLRVGDPGAERPVLLTPDGTHLDLGGITSDITGDYLADGGTDRVRRALDDGGLRVREDAAGRTGAPVARPSAVVCIGMNYAAHAAETGSAPPAEPVVFYKAPNTVVGPDDDVLIPRGSSTTDWEVELAVVIGRQARYLEPDEDPLSYVAGYTISNDVSERTLQLERSGGQWSKGKSCETFNPLGPWLVTADEVPDPHTRRLRTRVNGELRQDSTTADMVFGVAELIRELSQVMVLEPGDVLNTGTPQGVALSGRFPYLAAGDVVQLEIEGLGSQTQHVRQA